MTELSGRMVEGEHVLPIRIYYEDTDTGGIVYHANYLRYAERARTEMLRLVGIEQREVARDLGLFFAVRGFAVDYHKPAVLDDLLEVRSRLTRLGAASLDAVQKVQRSGTALAVMRVRIACIGRDGRPLRIPTDLREALQVFCQIDIGQEEQGQTREGP